MLTIIAESVTARFSSITMTGSLVLDAGKNALLLNSPDGTEVLSINLMDHGLIAELGAVFIKDWSEHSGLAASLEEVGVIEVLREVRVGPFRSRAFEVRPIITAPARELAKAGA